MVQQVLPVHLYILELWLLKRFSDADSLSGLTNQKPALVLIKHQKTNLKRSMPYSAAACIMSMTVSCLKSHFPNIQFNSYALHWYQNTMHSWYVLLTSRFETYSISLYQSVRGIFTLMLSRVPSHV